MWPTGAKAFHGSGFSGFNQERGNGPFEQALSLSKPAKHSIRVFCFSLSYQNGRSGKWSSFEAQSANLETFQATSFSLDPQRACTQSCTFTGRRVELLANRGWSSLHSVPVQQSDRFRLKLGAILALHVAHSHDSNVMAEHEANEDSNCLKRPLLRQTMVPTGTRTSIKVLLDGGEHEISPGCDNGAQKSGHAVSIESQEACIVVGDASENVSASNDREMAMYSVQHIENGSRSHSVDDDSSYRTQDGEMPMIMGGRALKGLNVTGETETPLGTRGLQTGSERVFEGLQPIKVRNCSIGIRNPEHDFMSHIQTKVTGNCDDGQICEDLGGIDAVTVQINKQSRLIERSVEGQNPALPAMADMNKVMNPVEPSSNVLALRMPLYRPHGHLQKFLDDSARYLEDLGVDCARIFEMEPCVKVRTVRQIKSIVSTLERYGLNSKDAGRVFFLCPQVLLLDREEDITLVADFLFYEAGLSEDKFCKVVRRCPRLLVMDLNTRLRPTLKFLRTLGYTNIGHNIAVTPALLSYDVNSRILPRLRLLESWGLTYREAAAITVRFPALFNYSASRNLECKYEYLVKEIKASKKDLLAFPQYFGYSLERKIRPRHLCIAKLNVSVSLEAMLTLSDAKFSAKFLRGNQF